MKTDSAPKHEVRSQPEERQPAQREIVPLDWTEAEWFKVWLKLARHEPSGQEAMC